MDYGPDEEGWFAHPKTENAQSAYYSGKVSRCTQTHRQSSIDGGYNSYVEAAVQCSDSKTVWPQGTLSACVADPNEFAWWNGGGAACSHLATSEYDPWDTFGQPVLGPNKTCPTAMLGLSSDPSQLYSKLDHMYPVSMGGTKVDVGLMWGLRALSNRNQWTQFWGTPTSNPPSAFGDADHRKVMIVLTDGQNQYPYHAEGYYGCSEDGTISSRRNAPNCRQSADLGTHDRTSLDNLTLDACEQIRTTYDVELYTIAVDVTDSTALSVLQTCAGDSSRFFDVSSSDLDSVFENLATESLRLTR